MVVVVSEVVVVVSGVVVLVSGVVGAEGGRWGEGQRAVLGAGAQHHTYSWRRTHNRLGNTNCVIIVVGGICYPGNKKLLRRAIRLCPSFPLQRSQRRSRHCRAHHWPESPGGAGG